MIGNEGVTGTSLLLGCDSTPATVLVQSPGYGHRIKADILKEKLKSGGTLQKLYYILRRLCFFKQSSAPRITVNRSLIKYVAFY